MKLAFVNFYSGIAERGGETYVDSLANELASKHQVYLFQAGPVKKGKKYITQQIKIHFNPNHLHNQLPVTHPLKRFFLDYSQLKQLLFTFKLLPALWRLKPEVIFPQNSGWEVLLLRIFSTFIQAKIIVAGQSGPGWNDRVNLYVHPDIFVALTNTQAYWAEKATPWKNQKIVVIPNGVNLQKFSRSGKKISTGFAHPVVLAVGAAIKSKRIKDTIRAVAKLKDVSLIIAGTGPQEKNEDLLAKKLLGKRYKRIKILHQDMPSLYRAADVFTLCSDSSEAFGIVYLEALASGLPCVITDDPSRREILGNVGIYVKKPEDANEYAIQIKKALKYGQSMKFIKRASQFSWSKIAEKYEKILEQK